MVNPIFFKKKKDFVTIKEILELTNSRLPDSQSGRINEKIHNIATLDVATKNDLSFFHSSKYLEQFQNSQAGYCFTKEEYIKKAPKNMTLLINENPYFAYAVFASEFYQENFDVDGKISSKANISKNAKIGKNCTILDGAYIGNSVEIGDNCFIGANAVINDNVKIGNNCQINALAILSFCTIGNDTIIYNGAKIGQDGFGFAHSNGKLQKVPQLGIVEIGNNVEIGAGSCIDRGAVNNTIIKDQVKIDNLVQIGHNVEIDIGTVIAGCTAIAGSVKIGKFVQIGGGSGIAGHIEIGDGTKIAGRSGVAKSISAMQSVGGYPAIPIKEWHRINIKLKKI